MKVKLILVVVALLGSLSLASVTGWAAHRSTAEEAQAFFDAAVELVETDGTAAAIDTFNDPESPFVKGDLYVFAVDPDGEYLASGANPKLSGTAFEAVVDAVGHNVYQLMVEAVDNPEGQGIIEYEWLNRQTNQVEKKHSFVKKLPDMYLGVGYYE